MSHFEDLFDLIGQLARRRRQMAEQQFDTLGLNHTEARLLGLLHHRDAVAQDALSAQLMVDRSNAVRALQHLEDGGYILRRKDDDDKRAKIVRLTDKGHKAVTAITKLRKQMAHEFFASLKEDEARRVVELLRKAIPAEGRS